ARGFRYYFTPLPGYFSPFPHGTSPLSVTKEYLALEVGTPSFSPRFTGADLLRNACGRSCDFVYGTIALFGAWFHTLRLPHDLVTSAEPATARTRRPTTPAAQRVAAYTQQVWADPLSLATTRGVSFDLLSSGYRDVSLPPLVFAAPMCSTRD